jgi:hypothetical protein
MTLLHATIRDRAVQLLTGATIAGPYVVSSSDIAKPVGDQPYVFIYVMSDRGVGKPSGMPRFLSTLTLALQCVVSGPELRTVEQDLDALAEQVVNGLLCNPAFIGMLDGNGARVFEAITNLEMVPRFSGEGDRHIGTMHIALGIQYHDVYQPTLGPPLTTIGVTVKAGQPAGVVDEFTLNIPQ